MNLKKLQLILILIVFLSPANSETIDSLKNGHEYSLYSGIFDTIDKEKDDKATLYGLEHNNPVLFKDTFIGRFSPITGGFITDKDSIFIYTGVQAQYEIGLLKITPSFAPGYYEKGDGKDLGMALEFQSKIKISFDFFKDTKIGYSYSHISNNDWGTINPGVNNEIISFSKIF